MTQGGASVHGGRGRRCGAEKGVLDVEPRSKGGGGATGAPEEEVGRIRKSSAQAGPPCAAVWTTASRCTAVTETRSERTCASISTGPHSHPPLHRTSARPMCWYEDRYASHSTEVVALAPPLTRLQRPHLREGEARGSAGLSEVCPSARLHMPHVSWQRLKTFREWHHGCCCAQAWLCPL